MTFLIKLQMYVHIGIYEEKRLFFFFYLKYYPSLITIFLFDKKSFVSVKAIVHQQQQPTEIAKRKAWALS